MRRDNFIKTMQIAHIYKVWGHNEYATFKSQMQLLGLKLYY
jgi:hypothetical protein